MSVDNFLAIVFVWQVAGMALSLIVGLLCYYIARIFTGITSIDFGL